MPPLNTAVSSVIHYIVSKRVYKKIGLWTLRILAGLVILVIILAGLIYVPAVQDAIVPRVLDRLNAGSDTTYAVRGLRLRFPLDITVTDAAMLAYGDTAVSVRDARLNIDFWPLLSGDVRISSAGLSTVYYRQGTPDSTLYMTARLRDARLHDASLGLKSHLIDVDRLSADGIRVDLVMLQDTTQTPPDTTQTDWRIRAREIELGDVTYRMQMLPLIDTLTAHVADARLVGGDISLARRTMDVDTLAVDSVSARYLLPSPEYLAAHPADTVAAPAAPITPDDRLWTIRGRHIALTRSDALYAVSGAVPAPGLDMNYIQASDINIAVDSFYNRGVDIVVPLSRLTLDERCGIHLDASGTFSMNAGAMEASGFDISTLYSHITLDAAIGIGDLLADPTLPLRLKADADIGLRDVMAAMPPLTPVLAAMPRDNGLKVNVDVSGVAGDIEIAALDAGMPGCFGIEANGRVIGINDFDTASGNISLSGNVRDGNMLKATLLQSKTGTGINIPPLKLDGHVTVDRGTWAARMRGVTGGGTLALDGRWNGNAESYSGDVELVRFPVNSFMPSLGVGAATVRLDVSGRGYNPLSANTVFKAAADVTSVEYLKREYKALRATADIAGGHADISLDSDNRPADFTLTASGNLAGQTYDWNVDLDIRNLDLRAIGLTDSVSDGRGHLAGTMSLSPSARAVTADLRLSDFSWQQGNITINNQNIDLAVTGRDTLTSAHLVNGDLTMSFTSPMCYDSLMSRVTAVGIVADSIMRDYRLDVPVLQRALPPMTLTLDAGQSNVLAQLLSSGKIAYDTLYMRASNDSLIRLDAALRGFRSGTTLLDTITLAMSQVRRALKYRIAVDNRPGTMDAFAHVEADGFISRRGLAVMFRQSDISDKVGYTLGLLMHAEEKNRLSMHIIPEHPVIAYKEWTVNKDNYLIVDLAARHLAADLRMRNDESSISIYTAGDSTAIERPLQPDVNVSISDMKLSDWLSINPFAPPVRGDLSADVRLGFEENSLNGTGTARLSDFYYGKQRVGDFDLDLDLRTIGRALKADVSLDVDGHKRITASGVLNDTTAVTPMSVDVVVDSLPLSIVNPFLPVGTATIRGSLSGQMKATGRLAEPVLDGWLTFDSTAVRLAMTGTDYRFSQTRIPVDSNRVAFNGFEIRGTNDNPLVINGTVDASSLIEPRIDLRLKASDFGVVNSSRRARGAQVYGRAFIDLDSRIRGTLSFLNIDAALNLLPGTNVTYVLDSDVTTLTSQSADDMVRFVNFNDTVQVARADTIAPSGMLMNLDARLTVSDGSTVNVDLSADGKNKASVQSAGNLNFHIDPMGDMRLTGRLNINDGFVRYTPPFMSEKNFSFLEGSYVSFSGDVMNPLLNIHAVDRMRANVTQQGQNSRLIYFDVALNVTGTLENMNVAFDLSTDDDITVQNELESMSPEQRANQAMNLLLYNMYTGKGTTANSNLSGNALYSFLASQLNNWAANTIKGVDISFGIDQYDRTVDGTTGTTMSYSYRVSKSLFNDRFKIIVGGNYSTDADADENFSQNLINDISFEYLINKAGTMYVRLFRHTGYESILEGEITQTGVGFVYKRKMRRLSEVFKRQRKETQAPVNLPEQTELKPVRSEAIRRDDEKSK